MLNNKQIFGNQKKKKMFMKKFLLVDLVKGVRCLYYMVFQVIKF